MIEMRALTTMEEFGPVVEMEREVWGFSELELIPRRLFLVLSKAGGQVFGAFDGDEMIAFLFAVPAVKANGRCYLHSDMLAVRAAYRDKGVGRMLKLKQRDDALARGITLVEWTFDPLELRNAYFNMERLGATVRRYAFNRYGFTSSTLHGDLPTDRSIAEWYIASDHVRRIVAGEPSPRPETLKRIVIPQAVRQWRTEAPDRVRQVQREIGEQFAEYFDQGLSVTGFERTSETGTYLFGKWDFE